MKRYVHIGAIVQLRRDKGCNNNVEATPHSGAAACGSRTKGLALPAVGATGQAVASERVSRSRVASVAETIGASTTTHDLERNGERPATLYCTESDTRVRERGEPKDG